MFCYAKLYSKLLPFIQWHSLGCLPAWNSWVGIDFIAVWSTYPAEEILANLKKHRQVPIKHSQHGVDLCQDFPNNKWQIDLVHLTGEPAGLVCKGNQAASWRDPTQFVAARKNCSSASLAALVCLKFLISRKSGLKVNLERLQGVCCGSCYCEVTIW